MPATIPYFAQNVLNRRYGWPTTGGTPAGALPGQGVGPGAPDAGYVPLEPDPRYTQQQALEANLGNLGNLGALTNWVNQLSLGYAQNLADMNRAQADWLAGRNASIAAADNAAALAQAQRMDELNRQQLRAQQEQYIPGLAGLESQASQNAAAQLAGIVSPATYNVLAQAAAERGAGRGFGPQSPATLANLLYRLGGTSEQRQVQGQQTLSSLRSGVPNLPLYSPQFSTVNQLNLPAVSGQPFNPAALMLTNEAMQTAQRQSNWNQAMPNPAASSRTNFANMMAGANTGYGRTAPGMQFNPYGSAMDTTQQIIQRYSQPPTQPQAPGQGYYYPEPAYDTSAPPYTTTTDEYSYYDPWGMYGQASEPGQGATWDDWESWLYGE